MSGRMAVWRGLMLLVISLFWLPACGSGQSARKGDEKTTVAAAGSCQGQFQKKLLDITADLQKMGDQNYRVEMSEGGEGGGVTIYSRTMPQAVRQYLTASHVGP